MNPKRITTIPICPSTNVRSTQGDRWLFAVSDEYLSEYDSKKALAHPDQKKGRNLNRKRQLEKYNAYKDELRWLAKQAKFEMPRGYFALWFYVPFPKTWLRYKSKCALMWGKPHETTPDWDNFIKAIFDALMPRKSKTKGEKGSDDRRIHCGAPFKVWVYPEEACIKIVEYDEIEFMEQFRHGHPSHSKLASG